MQRRPTSSTRSNPLSLDQTLSRPALRAGDDKPLQPRAGEAERAMEAVRRDARVILEAERTIGQQPPDKGGAARRVADRQQQQRAAAPLRIAVAKDRQSAV